MVVRSSFSAFQIVILSLLASQTSIVIMRGILVSNQNCVNLRLTLLRFDLLIFDRNRQDLNFGATFNYVNLDSHPILSGTFLGYFSRRIQWCCL